MYRKGEAFFFKLGNVGRKGRDGAQSRIAERRWNVVCSEGVREGCDGDDGKIIKKITSWKTDDEQEAAK